MIIPFDLQVQNELVDMFDMHNNKNQSKTKNKNAFKQNQKNLQFNIYLTELKHSLQCQSRF